MWSGSTDWTRVWSDPFVGPGLWFQQISRVLRGKPTCGGRLREMTPSWRWAIHINNSKREELHEPVSDFDKLVQAGASRSTRPGSSQIRRPVQGLLTVLRLTVPHPTRNRPGAPYVGSAMLQSTQPMALKRLGYTTRQPTPAGLLLTDIVHVTLDPGTHISRG